MGASYNTHIASSASSFSSPSMGANEVGILCQLGVGTTSHGIPTWDGSNMTLAAQRNPSDTAQGVTSVWYILNPTAGVTTIARGSNVANCYAIRSLELANGTIILDTDTTGGNGLGDMTFAALLASPGSFIVSCGSKNDAGSVSVGSGGEQTERVDEIVSTRNYWMGTSEGSVVADFDNHIWDWGGFFDACGVAVAFAGRRILGSNAIIKL